MPDLRAAVVWLLVYCLVSQLRDCSLAVCCLSLPEPKPSCAVDSPTLLAPCVCVCLGSVGNSVCMCEASRRGVALLGKVERRGVALHIIGVGCVVDITSCNTEIVFGVS